MSEQLTKREQIAAMLAAAWLPTATRIYDELDDANPWIIDYANALAIRQADDLLRQLEETEAKNNA